MMTVLAAPTATQSPRGDYSAEVLKDKPLAFWRFAESDLADGATVRDAIGKHNGRCRGKVRQDTGPPAIKGRAAVFDGSGAYVEIPASSDLDLNALSIEFWIKSTQKWNASFWPGSAAMMSRATAGAGSADWTIVGGNSRDGKRNGCLVVGSGPKGGDDTLLTSAPGLNDGSWRHVVWTRSASGDNCLYIDGTPAGAATDGGGPIVGRQRRPIQIGGDPWLKGRFLRGALAEAAIYPRVLSPERVRAHALAGGLTPRKASPAKAPTVDDPAGTVAARRACTAPGWVKHPANPVLGGRKYGTIFDVSVVRVKGEYWMYNSWRPKKSVALSKSKDGVNWGEPVIVLPPTDSGWEIQTNRPGVVYRDGVFHMWYTGQAKSRSRIGYATSIDGVSFTRRAKPVLEAEAAWEKTSVMCPHVEWDVEKEVFRMWYSGGEDYEPDAIGYSTSTDGVSWKKHAGNPIFRADPSKHWEKAKVTAGQIVRKDGWHMMFYIGFETDRLARIGLARSRDGITNWRRHRANPIISPTPGAWDGKSCYKPFVVYEKSNDRWLLWYNGRNSGEKIGLAIRKGEDLGFGK